MTRLVISLALVAACSGAAKTGTTAGSAELPPVVKKVAVSWGFEQHGEMADVFLATTDETGKQVSHPLGRYKGVCSVITPGKEMNAVTGVQCRTGPTGTELHAVIEKGEDIVIVKLGVDEGVRQDPMAREEVTRVKVPPGAKIEVGGRAP
jgi:hypothetical protein